MRKLTNKQSRGTEVHEMKPEYDFAGGVRGKHASRYAKSTNIVVLDPDVAAVFRDSVAVNETLRALLPIIARRKRRPAREPRRA